MENAKPRVVQLRKKTDAVKLPQGSEQDEKVFQAKIKIEKAKDNALAEIETFKSIIRTAQEECNKLAMFDNVSVVLQETLIEGYLDLIVEPTIKGNKPFGVTDAEFAEARKKLFKKLISHYDK